MDITFEGVGKRYNHRWIFRNITFEISAGQSVAITGHNGSGKSTLLQILMGSLPVSEGRVGFSDSNRAYTESEAARHFAVATPYTDLIEEMRLGEFLAFHRKLRQLRLSDDEFLGRLGTNFNRQLLIRELSSGMKQRVKLLLALSMVSGAVVLDEPTTNLDVEGRSWFHSAVDELVDQQTLVIASNDEDDMQACSRRIHVPDYAFSPSLK